LSRKDNITLKSNIAHLSILLIAALLLAACGSEQPSGVSLDAQATIEALAAEVETLQAQVAALQGDAPGVDDGSLIAQVASGQVNPAAETIAGEQADAGQPVSPVIAPADANAATSAAVEEPTPEPTAPAPPTNTPTPPPPPTPLPTFVRAPLDGDPPADRYRPEGRIGEFWTANDERQQSLGWALEEGLQPLDGVVQNFEHGLMFWRSDTDQIFALWTADGRRHWRAVEDAFEEGEMEKDPAITAPGGLRQPERGFGKAWRIYPDLREGLGWALEKERKINARTQAFERGQVTELGLTTYAIGQTPAGETTWDVE